MLFCYNSEREIFDWSSKSKINFIHCRFVVMLKTNVCSGEGNDSKPLVILEIANNHMGDVQHGVDLINTIADVIANFYDEFEFGFKFQFRNLPTFIHPDYKGSDLKYVKRFEETQLSDSDWDKLIQAVRHTGAQLLATPFDEASVDRCMSYDVDHIKIASCSITDWPLIECAAKTQKPVIFSTAGANLDQIDAMVSFFENRMHPATLMHCVGLYPTKADQLNIGQVSFYRERYPHVNVGYSTHEHPSSLRTGGLAYALGARVFEKHVGLSNHKYDNNAYSASPDQLRAWLQETKKSIQSVGERAQKIRNTSDEIQSLRALQRGMFARQSVKAGQQLTEEHLFFAIPCATEGFTANNFSKYDKFVAKNDIKAGEAITYANTFTENNRTKVKKIVEDLRSFVRNTGVPIPGGAYLEISHHYGLDQFYETGLAMITIVNEEYCKKLLFILPGQCHPEQFHKKKKETFYVVYGRLNLTLDGDCRILSPGETQTIKAGVRHKFTTDIGCVIEEISTTHEIADSFYVDKKIDKNANRKTVVKFWV